VRKWGPAGERLVGDAERQLPHVPELREHAYQPRDPAEKPDDSQGYRDRLGERDARLKQADDEVHHADQEGDADELARRSVCRLTQPARVRFGELPGAGDDEHVPDHVDDLREDGRLAPRNDAGHDHHNDPDDDHCDAGDDEPGPALERAHPGRVAKPQQVALHRKPDGRPALGAAAGRREAAEVVRALAAGEVGDDFARWTNHGARWRAGGAEAGWERAHGVPFGTR